MKRLFGFVCLIAVSCCIFAGNFEKAWKESTRIEKKIKRTSFPKHTYNITDFGAQPEQPDTPCHDAINHAILVCNQNGGGTVLIPKGNFYTGPITLKSNVNLHLEEGATLRFLTNPKLYYPAVLTRWEGLDCYNAHPLIYAYGETNIAITGKGVIDGQGANDNWWSMCGAKQYGWEPGMISQSNGARRRLLMWGETSTPIHQRVFTPEDGMRPQLINLYGCNRILIEGVTLLNSPFWVIHPLFCESMIVRGVNIFNRGPNGDGCDPESSKNILIEDCLFDTGDDCIAIKSGRNADGRKWNIPSENILIRNCRMKNGHGGVVIGSEISGGYRNLFVENCEMDSPELERVIRIKSNPCRGGIIENIYVRNIKVGQCKEAVLKINLQYESNEPCDRSFPPVVRNVYLKNVTCQQSDYGVFITGLPDESNIYNIQVEDCHFNHVKQSGSSIQGAKDVIFNNLYINGEVHTN